VNCKEPIDVVVLLWALRLVGVIGLALMIVMAAWKIIAALLRWKHVYSAFREWYMIRCFDEVKRKKTERHDDEAQP
jgi:hypothetical protein